MIELIQTFYSKIRHMDRLLRKESALSIGSLLLVGVGIHLAIPYFFYFYLLFVGLFLAYYVLRDTKFNRISILFLSSFFWSSCLLIFLTGLIALLSIPVSLWMLWIPLLLLSVLVFFKPPEFKKIEMKFEVADIILLILGIVSIGSRVFSVIDYLVPILHDPIAHAVWAKQIYETGLINYFYSPGLHILSAFGMMVDGVNVSKYVLLVTNIFNALSFVPVYLFVKSYFKDKKLALLSAAIFVIAVFPAKFFWAAGKNGLVMAIPVMFLALFVASLELNKISKAVILNLLIFSLILMHYPVAFIALIGIFFILIYRDGLKGLFNIILGCGLGLVWGLVKMQYEVEHIGESVSISSTGMSLSIENILFFLRDTYLRVQNFLNFPFGNSLLFFGLLGLGIMTVTSLKKKRCFYFMLFFYTNLFFIAVISFSEKLSPFSIIASTQHITFFVFIYIGAGFLFAKVVLPYLLQLDKRFFPAFCFFLVVLTLFSGYQVYFKYARSQEELNLVYEEDLEAFEWMSENIEKGNVILNNAVRGDRKNVVFASDGGAWLSVFTDIQIAMPFTDFSSRKTHNNYERYQKVFKNDYSCEDIEYLLENNINYYYRGSSGVFGGQVNPSSERPHFLLIYSSQSAKVYQILPCD